MHATMVKKLLLSGQPCKKCAEAEDLLRSRGLWGRIDRVVVAVEGDAASEGMQLAQRHGVGTAPFFILRDEDGREHVVESTLKVVRALADGAEHRPVQASSEALSHEQAQQLIQQNDGADPRDTLRCLLARFGRDAAIAWSGAEDVVLIDMAVKSGHDFSVFCLDTGRLHPETYRFIDKVRAHYGIEIALYTPPSEPLQALVRKKGLFSFYEDGHGECCGIRKIDGLRRALAHHRAWITGQRRDQSPNTRAEVPVLQIDAGNSGKPGSGVLLKANPLANWSSAQVWRYIRDNAVPYNELHERGFVSIGCEPCTRPVLPGQHEREGRWWWEEATKKECGLHVVQPHGDGI
jgi:phosphoadenosine phosphosulfate reductase